MEEKPHHGNKWMPVMYVNYYGILKDISLKHGYALTVHGSITRDFDLVAIPWIENPSPHADLLTEIRDMIGSHRPNGEPYDSMEEKPHGRIAYTIGCGAGGYFDISIMPLK